ncbi:hypothetical protein VDGD_05043 [Verticillium dahliae]|nr:hypothetical protein VdG1_03966 [Verticillium dahliae VDG1]RBQ93843.1 hypothetical protein VDGD_05043 [Verticillium dahliae]
MLKSLVVLLLTSLVIAFPTLDTDQTAALHKPQATPNSQGTHGGFFYYWWSDGQSPAAYTNLDGGSYCLRWESGGNLIGGKGWSPGTDNRTIQISGTFQGVENSYLAVYGWLETPKVEYYIVEYHGVFNPAYDAQILGTVICDGSVYDMSRSTRVSSGGTKILPRYWSVRRNKRTGGMVQTGCHFDAWRSTGLSAADHGFQIVATEGYFSSGFAEMTVADTSAEE